MRANTGAKAREIHESLEQLVDAIPEREPFGDLIVRVEAARQVAEELADTWREAPATAPPRCLACAGSGLVWLGQPGEGGEMVEDLSRCIRCEGSGEEPGAVPVYDPEDLIH